MRLRGTPFNYKPFQGHPNILEHEGDFVELHAHGRPHLLFTEDPLLVEAIVNGEPVTIESHKDIVGVEFWYVAAKVQHKITSLNKDGPAHFTCMFSMYDENGVYHPDPKCA